MILASGRIGVLARSLLAMAAAAALSACATTRAPEVNAVVEAKHYAQEAHKEYRAPGTRDDPWGPYVIEAAARFDVPGTWIRSVMHQESGGLQFRADGTMTISDKGAMGLMQVMPETYDELKSRYSLGEDPYDPHNNILAGTAYMRELYDLYGAPGFLAAYNCGPGCLDRYLANNAALPNETRRYVAMIAPNLLGVWPVGRSPAEQLAMNHLPINIPAGLRYAPVRYASRRRHGGVMLASSARHTRDSEPAVMRVAYRTPVHGHGHAVQLAFAAHGSHDFHWIETANAATLPPERAGGWAIQVGAFGNAAQARAAAGAARSGRGTAAVGTAHQTHGVLYRARVTGLSREAAVAACQHQHRCMVLSPGAQS